MRSFGHLFRAIAVFSIALDANHLDRRVGQIADDGVHFFTHIAHFGELGGFNFDERRVPPAYARRRAISVLPTPVGPIIRMFLASLRGAALHQAAYDASGYAEQ